MTPRAQQEPSEDQDQEKTGERLQRVLAARGVASRRASEALITAGRVQVNGQTVTELGTRVHPTRDEIRVDGKPVRRQKPRFIVLNKPSGFITTVSDEKQRWTVMDLIDVQERVYPVGRLDRETQGLLLLTNEGDVANRIMHPKFGLAKEYHVITGKKPNDRQLQRIRDGIEIQGRTIVPDECRLLREGPEGVIVKIVLHEGKYHVVRQIMDAVNIEVVKLRRVRIGPLTLTGIPPGAWRDLTPGELSQLYEALGLPAEEADKMNARRPQQLLPVGGFQHTPQQGNTKRSSSPSHEGGTGPRHQGSESTRQERGRRPGWGDGRPQERRGDRRSSSPDGRPGDPRRTNSRTSPGRDHDGSRPPKGHRNRRPGGGR
ncbi:MAG TPA: pseudouridine synthase [Thermomicrobiales bacterium]|nr:pseudouridine synthase [Thermomicrobiales bacterium]